MQKNKSSFSPLRGVKGNIFVIRSVTSHSVTAQFALTESVTAHDKASWRGGGFGEWKGAN